MPVRVLVAWLPSSLGHACYNVRVDDPSITVDALFHALPQFAALTWPPDYTYMVFVSSTSPSIVIDPTTTVTEAIQTAVTRWPHVTWCIQLIPALADSPYGFPQALVVNLASTM